jgi:ketosteroid isomerase-like protein
MPGNAIEVVEAGFDAWNASDMDAWGELLAPDVVVHLVRNWPEPGPFVGREAALRQFVQMRDAFGADRVERIREYVEAGNRVVARLVWRGRGQGPSVNMELSCVYMVRNGQLVGLDFFWDPAEALEAAGMSE